jgi:hypothetical protein
MTAHELAVYKYNHSAKAQAAQARYRLTEGSRAKVKRYANSPAGKIMRKLFSQRPDQLLRGRLNRQAQRCG